MPLSLSSPVSCSSPVVDVVMARKRKIFTSRQKWKWALVNFTGAIILLLEASAPSFHWFAQLESPWRFWISSVELSICALLAVNTMVDLYTYLFPLGMSSENTSEISLSPLKMKLLGVSNQDSGFKATPPAKPKESSRQHPFGFASPLNGSFISPQNSTMFSGQFSSMDSSSWIYQGTSPRDTKLENNRDFKPNLSMNGTFTDEASLKHFLSDYEEKEKILEISNGFNASKNETGTMWNANSPVGGHPNKSVINQSEQNAILRNVSYQLSTPMPFSPDATKNGGSPSGPIGPISGPDTKCVSLCRKVGIDPLDLVFWMQNIRIWLNQTILTRVVRQIDTINESLVKSGLGDCLIGSVGVEKLKKCATLPQIKDHIELNNLLPFLSISTNQEYLVYRIKELAKGGALSNFSWNSGGRFNGKDWTDKLPCDAEIVMGCFAAYMDTRMPANFRNTSASPTENSISYQLEDKPFTGVFFVVLPESGKSDKTHQRQSERELSLAHRAHDQQSNMTSSPRSVVVLQSAERPSHYILLIDGKERLELSRGRNNLFHTLLFFLHHIKTKENGMLGRINLGVSGINILWVIDSAAVANK
eukprot:14736.XXX_502468_500641_1 [CDS] Oithona nana genome sequencing.